MVLKIESKNHMLKWSALATIILIAFILFQNCSPIATTKSSVQSTQDKNSCPKHTQMITCPFNGVVFAPKNPNFISLVGNELQIAIAYGADLNYIADLYNQALVRNVRVLIDWAEIESTMGIYNWNYTDMRVGMFPTKGINPVGIISATPQWAAPACGANSAKCTPDNINDLKRFARLAVQRYGPNGNKSIRDWEVRVEAFPNQGYLTKEQYVIELNAVRETIKAEDPTARIWGPEVAFLSNSPDVNSAANAVQYEWINYTIAHGEFDVFSIHHLAATTPEVAYAHTKHVRKLLNDAGYTDIPLAITATALVNPIGTEEQQAQNIQDMYACISAGGADYAFWFAGTEWAPVIADIPNDVTYGILDYDFNIPSKIKPKLAHKKLLELSCSAGL